MVNAMTDEVPPNPVCEHMREQRDTDPKAEELAQCLISMDDPLGAVFDFMDQEDVDPREIWVLSNMLTHLAYSGELTDEQMTRPQNVE